MSNNSNSGGSTGVGLTDILLVVFIVLKLCGIINWSWLWVLSPLWIPIVIVLLGGLGYFLFRLFKKQRK